MRFDFTSAPRVRVIKIEPCAGPRPKRGRECRAEGPHQTGCPKLAADLERWKENRRAFYGGKR